MLEVLLRIAFAVMLALGSEAGAVVQLAPAPPVSPAPDVDAYVASIGGPLGRLGGGVQGMVEVMGTPALASEEWQARAAAAFAEVAAGHATLVEFAPPAQFEDAHAALVAATQHCADGAAAAQAAIDSGEVAGLYAAGQLLDRCGAGIEAFGAMLERMQ